MPTLREESTIKPVPPTVRSDEKRLVEDAVVEKKFVVVALVPVARFHEKLEKNGVVVPVNLWKEAVLAKMKSPPVNEERPVPPCGIDNCPKTIDGSNNVTKTKVIIF